MPKSRLLIIGITILVIIGFFLVFSGVIPGLKPSAKQATAELNFWGVFDPSAVIDEVSAQILGYKVNYRQFDPQTYETQLVNALAAGAGPDIFMFHSSWLPKHGDKISPITSQQLSINSLRDLFPSVIEQDFGPNKLVYAAPLYLDPLVMFYNKNFLDSKGVVLAPKTWVEFKNIIPKLRELDRSGKIAKAAAAIGGSEKSIYRAVDLLSALFLQSGVSMVRSDFGGASFAASGGQTLEFYTDFANPRSQSYTWSDSLNYSLDNFAQEKTAIIFGYAQILPLLKQKNPFLEIGVAALPQPSQSQTPVNFASYWGIAVANRFNNPLTAWNFIWQLTANPANAKLYAEKTNRLPALRSLISEKISDPRWEVYAKSALTARSWPQIDNTKVDAIFSKMISDVIEGRATVVKSISEAEAAVTELMEKKNRF